MSPMKPEVISSLNHRIGRGGRGGGFMSFAASTLVPGPRRRVSSPFFEGLGFWVGAMGGLARRLRVFG